MNNQPQNPPPQTETIDRLFLELSQFTTAKTANELRLEAEVVQLRTALTNCLSRLECKR